MPAGLRWFVRLSTAVWWVVILAWLMLLGATFALHVLIVPRIIDWRPQMEEMVAKAWGVQVSIGEVNSVSDGWVPSFELHEFVIRDAQGQQVLRLPVVRASLTPASLLRMSLDRIELDGPELEIERRADGSWRVGGVPITAEGGSDWADWLLSQPNLHIQHGRLRWVDGLNQQAPVELSDVSLRMRNGLRSHDWRLDANPPSEWGQRISLQGQFTQAFFNRRASDVSSWKGSVYAQMPQLSLAPMSGSLQAIAPMGQWLSGHGWARVWVDVDHGQWLNPTVDLALNDLHWQSSDAKTQVEVLDVSGRVHWQDWSDGLGHAITTQDLKVTLADGEALSSGKLRLAWRNEGELWAKTGELHIDTVPLTVLTRLSERLPLDPKVRAALDQAKPQGQLQALDLRWSDAHTPAVQFNAKGQVADMHLQSSAPNSPASAWWWPGAQAAQVQFQITEHGGRAQVTVQDGSLSLVDWLEEPRIGLQKLTGEVSWAKQDQQWVLQIQQAQLQNEWAQGEFGLTWKEGPANKPLGHLDLKVQVQKLDAKALHRYLPREMDAQARHYLRDAIGAGQFVKAQVNVQGLLDHFPFAKTNDGVFTVNAPFQQTSFQYVPGPPVTAVAKREQQVWPALQQLSGELQINRNRLLVKSAAARLGAGGVMQVPKLEVQINDLSDIVIDVSAQLKGPLSDALSMVNASPLADKVGPYLGAVTANGLADHQLQLTLPLDNLSLSRVQGSVMLAGNDVQWMPSLPRFYKARGTVNYSESGMSVNGVRMRLLGGDAKLDGALRFVDNYTDGPTRLSLQGNITSDALRQAPELSGLSAFTSFMNGSANYVATLGLRQGQVVYSVSSNMQGMGLDLPPPMDKPKEVVWPLRIDAEPLRPSGKSNANLSQMQASLGQVLALNYVRDLGGAAPTVVRGQIQLGQVVSSKEPADQTVMVQVRHPLVNVDDWQQALSPWLDDDGPRAGPMGNPWQAYMPNRIEISTAEMTWLGRSFHSVQATADKQSKVWRVQAKATELQGNAEYRVAQGGEGARLVARLSHLQVPPSVLEEVESAMADSPKDMPALDIVVDNLELRGIPMGRAEIDGYARTSATGSREWVINKLNLVMPEASFLSKGQWGGAGKAAAKRSQLDFTLQIQDSGDLLERFGYKGAIRDGKGRMIGQVGWQGSPFSPDYNTMSGQFNVNLERGQFLKADPGVSRLLGVLSLQSLPRRLMLDFSDVFSEGFAFDFVRGDVFIQQNIASTTNLQMKGVSAAVLMEGHADIQRETQDIKVVVVPELNAGTASLFYSAINPVVGITSFLAQYFLRKPLIKSATQELRVQGSWKEPKVTKIDAPVANPAPAKP